MRYLIKSAKVYLDYSLALTDIAQWESVGVTYRRLMVRVHLSVQNDPVGKLASRQTFNLESAGSTPVRVTIWVV